MYEMMKKNAKFTYIVPVYNVEKYIQKCVMSIMEQNYKNIEIILIDDGSTDKSGAIIDKLASKDSRINVIHKKNEGVSTARNLGLIRAKGDYILFIDGDDYIDKDYTDYFYKMLSDTACSIAVNTKFYNIIERTQGDISNFEVLKAEEVIEMMYYGILNEAVWNKAYSRKFLLENEISFDKNIWFGEGMLFNIKCFQYVDNIAVGSRRLYHQTWNPNSAMRNFNLESNYCGIKSLHLQKQLWKKYTPDIELAWKYHLRCFNRSILVGIIKSDSTEKYKDEYKKCKKNLRKDLSIVLKAKIPIKRKIYYICMAIAPAIIAKMDVKKEKKYALK